MWEVEIIEKKDYLKKAQFFTKFRGVESKVKEYKAHQN